MAMGIPYVAFDVGAVRELSPLTAQRFLVKSGDIEMFAHKIENLLSDEKTYEDFRKEELDKIKEYSMDNVIEKFINLFK
jgi:glycosyltransferase involved in cell wall biosynthesis